MSKPNVFILVVDSLRADAVFGDGIATPNFDALARTGSAFHQCICTTTTTTPSFSSILTGCYPPKHGVRGLQGYRLSESVTTLAEAFGRAGYHTYAEVTGPLLPETGVLRGFHEANHRQGYRVPFFSWRESTIGKMNNYKEPWLMLLHIWEVHRPFRSPPDFVKRFDRAGYEAAVAATDEWLAPVFEAAGADSIVVVTGDHGEEYPESNRQMKLIGATRKVRRKLRLSRWAPALDNKLAAFAVGHGFALYEHLVRVPLILAGAGVPHSEVHEQVRHIDLFPTLAALCEVESPPGIDGRSLLPLMAGEEMPEEPAYMEAVGVKLEGRRIRGVRTPDWKLLKEGEHGAPRLYRLNGSMPPDEKHDVSSKHPEITSHLDSVLENISSAPATTDSGMTEEQEALVEQHLKDLGYL
ncbi:MAG TPA: sulfatase [Actinomycetota bacterium]|nr:sulfatase [Actinomycetota bacterium]